MAERRALSMADAALAFLDGLDGDQRAQACLPFDSTARHDWHYIPRPRPGLCLADMNPVSQKLVFDLLATGLSADGFAVACLVMALEDPLDHLEGGGGPRRGRQRPWGRHRAEYHAAVFGSPGAPLWAWRVEGHHLSVTATVVDGAVTATPCFLGANPAEVAAVRLLPREQDLAFTLLDAMPDRLRRRAHAGDIAPDDILTTNSVDIAGLLPRDEGVLLGDLGGAARDAAVALVDCYLGRLPHGPRPHVSLDAVRFAFLGEPRHRHPHYYRLLSPDLLVEYDNTQNGANHVHTVVRDPLRDFGGDALRRHLHADHG